MALVDIVDLHCIICFDAFTLDERPPVILPCGHTYVCAQCAKRLDKCMECRKPLFIKPQACVNVNEPLQGSGLAANDMPSWYRPPPQRQTPGRQPRHIQGQKPAQPTEPIALPVPKNLVMIALMEVSEREKRARMEEKKRVNTKRANAEGTQYCRIQGPSAAGSPGKAPPMDTVTIRSPSRDLSIRPEQRLGMNSASSGKESKENRLSSKIGSSEDDNSTEGEADEDESEIKVGIKAMLSNCGTYVVRDYIGLVVHSKYPSKGSPEGRVPTKWPVAHVRSGSLRVMRGQTVQVSHIDENGVACLARGHGFIPTTNSDQLVKVGNARDKACQVEGMLRSIELMKEEYEKKIEKLAVLEGGLKKDLKGMVDENIEHHPIIEQIRSMSQDENLDGMNAESGNGELRYHDIEDEPGRISPVPLRMDSRQNIRQLPDLMPPRSPLIYSSPGSSEGYSDGNASPYTIDNSEIGPLILSRDADDGSLGFGPDHLREASLQPLAPRQDVSSSENNFGIGCGFLAGNSYLDEQDEENIKYTSPRPSRGNIGGGPALSFDNVEASRIDYRTGFSGHRGLLGARTRADRVNGDRREIRRMSSHRGVGSQR